MAFFLSYFNLFAISMTANSESRLHWKQKNLRMILKKSSSKCWPFTWSFVAWLANFENSVISMGSSGVDLAKTSSWIFLSSTSNWFFGWAVLLSGDVGTIIGLCQYGLLLCMFFRISMCLGVIFGTLRPFRTFLCFSIVGDVWRRHTLPSPPITEKSHWRFKNLTTKGLFHNWC